MKPRILITGVNGMLGRCIYQALSHAGIYQLEGLGRSPQSQFIKTYWRGDLTDILFLRELQKEKFDIIIHCAAEVNVNRCTSDPAYCSQLHAGVIRELLPNDSLHILISTDSVFDGKEAPYSESAIPSPLNAYAKSKVEAEKVLVEKTDKYYILRTNLYGFHEKPGSSLFEWAVRSLKDREAIFGFTNVVFNPLYTRQIAEVVNRMILEKAETGIYNLAANEAISKFDFLKKIANLFNLDASLISAKEITPETFTTPRPLNTTLKNTKLTEAFPDLDLSLNTGFELLYSDYNAYLNRKHIENENL